jgi:hypothetical protein
MSPIAWQAGGLCRKPQVPTYRIAPRFISRRPACTERPERPRAREIEFKHLLVASDELHGAKDWKGAVRTNGRQLVVVTEHTGYHAQEYKSFLRRTGNFSGGGRHCDNRDHAFSSIARSFRLRWQGIDLAKLAESFRRFRGAKTCLKSASWQTRVSFPLIGTSSQPAALDAIRHWSSAQLR